MVEDKVKGIGEWILSRWHYWIFVLLIFGFNVLSSKEITLYNLHILWVSVIGLLIVSMIVMTLIYSFIYFVFIRRKKTNPVQ
jgi:hypothetical protein